VIVGIISAAVIVFQLFFRYDYIHTYGRSVTKIDRLTGQSCVLPCASTSANSANQPVETQANVDAKLIDHLRTVHTYDITEQTGHEWKVIGHYSNDGQPDGLATPDPDATEGDFPVRLVCYCDAKNTGIYYESRVQHGTFSEMIVIGNPILEKRYGISATK
jgi:hypothetical protein